MSGSALTIGRPAKPRERIVCPICSREFRKSKDCDKYCSPACGNEGTARKHLARVVSGDRERGQPEPKHQPTPDEIHELCREIQSEWSDEEFYRRAGLDEPTAEVRETRVDLTGRRFLVAMGAA